MFEENEKDPIDPELEEENKGNGEDDLDFEDLDDDDPSLEKPEETITIPKAKFNSMRRRAIAYGRIKKGSAKPITQPKQEHDDELVRKVDRLSLSEEKRQFGFDHNLSPKETDFVYRYSGGKPTKETLEDPFVKSGLEGFRASQRVESNTPGSNSRAPVFGEKPFKEQTEDERRSNFEKSAARFAKK